MSCFYNKIKKPILAMAPMAGFTDSAFRQICKQYRADLVYSEMASVDALVYESSKTLEMLKFEKKERPYIVQLFGAKPEHFAKAVELVEKKLKPDGIDINFGCPVRKVLRQGAGSALFEDQKKSKDAIKAVLDHTGLPVSVKTRTKVGRMDIFTWLENMNDLDIKAIMIHGRTYSQGFSGPIDVDMIKKAREYFNGIILANGSIDSWEKAYRILEATKADGLGIGRAALGRPWLFKEIKKKQTLEKSRKDVFDLIMKHARMAEKYKGNQGIVAMRAHLCWYVTGLPGATALRQKLVNVGSVRDIETALKG